MTVDGRRKKQKLADWVIGKLVKNTKSEIMSLEPRVKTKKS